MQSSQRGSHHPLSSCLFVEGGKFNWMQNDKFPSLTKEYEGYHGLSFAEEFGPVAFTMKARAEGMRDFSYASEIVLRRFMSTFIAHNREDQSALQKIMNSENAGNIVTIHCFERQRRRTDATSIPNGVSVHDAIVVDDDQAYNYLLDQNIDRILLSRKFRRTHSIQNVVGSKNDFIDEI